MERRNDQNRTVEEERREFQRHFAVFLVMSVFFLAINILSSPYILWFYWPILGWGIGLLFHYLKAYVPAFYEEQNRNGLELRDQNNQVKQNQVEEEEELELKVPVKKWNEKDLV